jgi:hypothetical protein
VLLLKRYPVTYRKRYVCCSGHRFPHVDHPPGTAGMVSSRNLLAASRAATAK